MSSRGMDTADDTDEDELLDYDVQMIIQESCQREHLTRSGRYSKKPASSSKLKFDLMHLYIYIYKTLSTCLYI